MTAPWMDIARKEAGQHEIAGLQDNLRILEYFRSTSFHAPHDEVPWCSAFVNWCMSQVGIVGTLSAAANSWASWGMKALPVLGAVVVLRHKSAGMDAATGSGSGFHVGFFVAQDAAHIRLLGGNQHDQVKESLFPLANYEVVALRWPSAVNT